jgi:hypothetical protein
MLLYLLSAKRTHQGPNYTTDNVENEGYQEETENVIHQDHEGQCQYAPKHQSDHEHDTRHEDDTEDYAHE